MTWYYKDEPLDPAVAEQYQGFVYVIENLTDGRRYVGKKNFHFKRTRKPLKGKTRKRRDTVPSDWDAYYGSNDELLADVARLGQGCFRREVLYLCKNKAEMSYLEAKVQFDNDVLLSDDWYNSWVQVKVRKGGLQRIGEML